MEQSNNTFYTLTVSAASWETETTSNRITKFNPKLEPVSYNCHQAVGERKWFWDLTVHWTLQLVSISVSLEAEGYWGGHQPEAPHHWTRWRRNKPGGNYTKKDVDGDHNICKLCGLESGLNAFMNSRLHALAPTFQRKPHFRIPFCISPREDRG